MAETIHPCCDVSAPCPIWKGTPTGRIVTIDGLEMYISQPENRKPALNAIPHSSTEESHGAKSGKRILLFLTEAHGIYLPNAQLLADSFASDLNCDAIMPDQFAGQARPLKNIDSSPRQFEEWKSRHEPPATDPILEKVVVYIRHTYGNDARIGGAGYCFGGRYVIRLMGAGVIDVGVINHPSFFTMEEVRRLGKEKSLAMYAAETDDILPPEKRRETEDNLSEAGATWMSTVFSGSEHGFSVRGDLTVKQVRLAKEKAFRGAVEWFNDWL